MRRAISQELPALPNILRELREFGADVNLDEGIHKFDKCCSALLAEPDKIAADQNLPAARPHLQAILAKPRPELGCVAIENGLM
ncbi:MAG TPA: hypothetical protein VML19_15885 [Verrucomicrobiae bacterium]|nr:hypothetical protein [Verrucomicrobiae bacterium]